MNNSEVLVKFRGDTTDLDRQTTEAKKSLSGFSSAIKTGFKVAAVGVATATAAVSGLVKASVNAYAEFEQLEGGLVSLFGEGSKAMNDILKSSANAWKDLTMSQNDYITSFQSSYPLVNAGLSENADAIEYTNKMMQISSDLFNTYGGSTEQYASAINWALKGSFVYLDNLNLGIKGTQEGFLQAANASGVLSKSVQNVKDLTTDEIIDVIQHYAKAYGVWGKTAQEASTTILGSMNMVKASWKNMIAGISQRDANIDGLINNLIGSVETFVDNIFPVIERALNGIVKALPKLINKIGKKLPSMIKNLLPSLIKGVKEVVNALLKALPTLLDVGVPLLINAVIEMVDTLVKMTPKIITTLISSVSTIVIEIAKALPTLLPKIIKAVVDGLIGIPKAFSDAFNQAFGIVKKSKGDITELADEINTLSNEVNDYSANMRNLAKARDDSLKSSASELGHYKALWNELKNITDENGKIKAGYEERAEVIANTLSNALGIEIELVNGQIKGYDKLDEAINKVIESKRAEAYLNAYQEEYTKALKDQADLKEKMIQASSKQNTAETAYISELEKLSKQFHISTKDLEAYTSGMMDAKDVQKKYGKDVQLLLRHHKKEISTLKNLQDVYATANDTLIESNLLYQDSQKTIRDYDTAVSEHAKGNYKAVETIFNSTVKFTSAMATITEENYKREVKANNEKYKEIENGWSQHIQFMKNNRSRYTDEQIAEAERQRDEELRIAREQKTNANRELKAQYETSKEITLTGINEQLRTMTDKNVEFIQVGRGQVQKVVDGVKQGKPMSLTEAQKMVNEMISAGNNEAKKAKTVGENIVDGAKSGVKNQEKQNLAFAAVKAFANGLLNALKIPLKIKSPSKATEQMGKYLMEGFGIGIDDEENSILKQVSNVSNGIVNAMQKQVGKGINVGSSVLPNNALEIAQKGTLDIAHNINPYANGINIPAIQTNAPKVQPIVNVYADFEMDSLGQVVSKIKTFSGGAKNDYNYGVGG